MSRFTLPILIAFAVLAASAVYFVVPTLSGATTIDPPPPGSTPESATLVAEPATFETNTDQLQASPSPPESAAPVATTPTALTYTDPVYGFSFEYPEGFGVGAFEEHNVDGMPVWTVLVQSNHDDKWFEVFVWPWLDLAPITSEAIIAMLESSGITVENPQIVSFGQDITSLSAFTHASGWPDAHEFWFSSPFREDYSPDWPPDKPLADLYQVRTTPGLENWLVSVLATWRFE